MPFITSPIQLHSVNSYTPIAFILCRQAHVSSEILFTPLISESNQNISILYNVCRSQNSPLQFYLQNTDTAIPITLYDEADVDSSQNLTGHEYYTLNRTSRPRMQGLSDDEEESVTDTFDRHTDRDLVYHTNFGIDVTPNMLSCLIGTTWLNEEVINYFLNLLSERSRIISLLLAKLMPPLHCVKVFCHTTYFFEKLAGTGYNYSNVSRWTKNVCLWNYDLVLLLPIHLNKV